MGDVLGTVYDLYGKPAHALRAQRDGVVISVPRVQYVEEGTHCGLVL